MARRWWKHIIGGEHGEPFDRLTAWNESSRRYITEEPVFWSCRRRMARCPRKTTSRAGDNLPEEVGRIYTEKLKPRWKPASPLYEEAMEAGICAEVQARLFLPAYGMYVRWVWTASLQAVAHFLKLRFGRVCPKRN